MKYLTEEYIVGEIKDTIELMKLNNEFIPELDDQLIEEMADAFLNLWAECCDEESNFDRTLLEFLRDEFRYNCRKD